MNETNTTIDLLLSIKQKSNNILHNIDFEIFSTIQNNIDKLYSGKYGEIFAYAIFGIPVANLVVALLVFLFFLLLRRLFTKYTVKSLLNFAKQTKSRYDDLIIQEIYKPVEFLFIVIGLNLFFKLSFLDSALTKTIINILITITLYWILYAIIPTIQELLFNLSKKENMLSEDLSRFIVRLVRIFVFIAGLLNILHILGVDITAFLASIGLGGLAFALAAKDTASNLFGSIALLIDESIKAGEWVKVAGAEGTVEDIGMRTTRIRTFDKSITILPNSIVANSPIENYSRRGIRRVKMTIGLVYSTTPEVLEDVLQDIRDMFKEYPKIDNDQHQLVQFTKFNDSSLDILIYTYAKTADFREYLQIVEDVNIKIMKIVNSHDTSFAFPSQSIYVESINEKAD